MDNNQIQQEISIIKEMIDKTRKETAESGLFFISIGFVAILGTITIGILEHFNLNHLVLPVMIIMLIINAILGYITVSRSERKGKVKSYHKTILYNVLFSFTVPAILIVFIFPLLKVYPWSLTPVLVSVLMGIMIYVTGVILEARFFLWCSLAWWAGALLMALVNGTPRIFIMITILLFGWILPGLILNRKYKNRSKQNGPKTNS